jgi:hypothetical protein
MEYKIIVMTPDGMEHPEIPVDDLGEALHTARVSLEKGYLTASKVTVKLGAGTIIRVMSDEELEAFAQRKVAFPIDLEKPWKLIIHHGGNHIPLDFSSELVAHHVVDEMVENGYLFSTVKDHHDYLYLAPMPGSIFMVLSTEEFKERQRRALEQQLQAQQQARQQEIKKMSEGEGSRIVIPGKSN